MNTATSNHSGVSLQVRGLRKSFDGQEVLKGLNFKVNPGEIFVIMGPSGSGKSVLLRHVIGLEPPDEGEILVNSLTVGENVGLYLTEHRLKSPEEISRIVSQNLELVGLKGVEKKMPSE